MSPAHRMNARSDRARGLSNRLAQGVVERLAHLTPVGDRSAGGMQRLEGRFRFSGLRADAQGEARTMDSPVIRVPVRIENLQGGARFEEQSIDPAVVGQPAANGSKVGGCQLPFHFPSVLGGLVLRR